MTDETKFFDFIIDEVFSAGGDGDCFIICKYYDLDSLSKSFFDYLSKKYKNYYLDIFKDYNIISDRSNESWTFMLDEYDKIPSWAQCIIRI